MLKGLVHLFTFYIISLTPKVVGPLHCIITVNCVGLLWFRRLTFLAVLDRSNAKNVHVDIG